MKLKFIYLSIATSFATLTLKTVAYLLTGSVGLLSDAAESIVNVVAAFTALFALKIAERPPDHSHPYGHEKAEYFSSVIEGTLILVAAGAIIQQALSRLFNPVELEGLGWGMGVSLVATVINLVVAQTLIRAGKRHDSIALEADGRHLMTDVVTSVGVLVGLLLVLVTDWMWLDSVIALLVAANILFEGGRLIGRSVDGLMDKSLPDGEEARIKEVLDRVLLSPEVGANYHGLRTRKSGSYRFVELHLLTPGDWSVQRAHALTEEVEAALRGKFNNMRITIHQEPLDDPRSYEDTWGSDSINLSSSGKNS